ncbi:hypothetical protein D9M71_698800 [compost metagenome]
MPLHGLAGAHQPDLDRVADTDAWQFGFFEIRLDIEGRVVNQRHHRLPGIDVVAFGQAQVGDMAIARCLDLAAGQVDLRRLDVGLSLAQFTTGHCGIDLRVLAQFGADRLRPQSGAARSFMFAQA